MKMILPQFFLFSKPIEEMNVAHETTRKPKKNSLMFENMKLANAGIFSCTSAEALVHFFNREYQSDHDVLQDGDKHRKACQDDENPCQDRDECRLRLGCLKFIHKFFPFSNVPTSLISRAVFCVGCISLVSRKYPISRADPFPLHACRFMLLL